MKRALPLLLACALSACASVSVGKAGKKVVLRDFAEGRVAQVVITDRLTGAKEYLFVSMPQKSNFLEGYIIGIVTDYEDNPIQGVVIRAVAEGEEKFIEKSQAAFQTSSFDAGVSDSNGVYRIRFSLPIVKNLVDVRGKLLYNPGWEQERDNLGKAYAPQTKESPFRLYFNQKDGQLIFAEGVRKTIVQPIEGRKAPKPKAAGAQPAEGAPAQPGEGGGNKEDDLLKSFFGGP
ncbi:MAG TPA: hypothetical protein DCM05_16520 [Elusimicrobia bacterium]|nr:hypothetical protein [Elusimicrobiota bacterium]